MSHGYPGSLGALGSVLELPENQQKLVDGRRLINMFCIPHDDAGTFFDYATHPADWQKFCEYGMQDTATLREIYRRLPVHNFRGENLETWFIDQLINERGFGFDAELATAARALLEKAKGKHEIEMRAATQDEVWAATQREKLKRYLESQGLALPNMRASTISEWLEHDDLSPELRFLLEARLEASKSSGAKYRRGLEMVGDGSRIRYGIRFAGAGRTGRFSHRGFQPGNMKRATVKFPQIEAEIAALKAGTLDITRGANTIAADLLRSSIVAAPGNELVVADYSNIEGRVLAWLAQETWKSDAYFAADRGEAADGYKMLYSRFFGIAVDQVDDTMRQIGKVVDLSMGYMGGVGAFVTMSANYKLDLDTLPALVFPTATPEQIKKAKKAWKRAFLTGEDHELECATYMACDVLKQVYRAANKAIYETGRAVGKACIDALKEPGSSYNIAKCQIWSTGSFLIIQLPSGRRLLYAKPRIEQEQQIDPETQEIKQYEYITYLTARGKGWIRERAWAGLFIENIVQAIAADVLRGAIRLVHTDTLSVPQIRGYLEFVEGVGTAISLHVHDEIVLDVPVGSYPVTCLITTMTRGLLAVTPWSRGLPLSAAGWSGKVYRK
jgi:DNA polymerase